MTERKRLIGLIEQCSCHYSPPCTGECGECHNVEMYDRNIEHIADHLLANGVIVPPCKVGTTLFFLYNSPYADKPDLTPRIYKTTDWYFKVDKAGIVINTSDIHGFNKVYDYVLGKTVFLTREEAEKALSERSTPTC